METVGFIGLGRMGSAMAGNIRRAGYPMVVHDVVEGATRALLEEGANPARSPAEVASHSDIIFTSLPGPKEVEAVALGARARLESWRGSRMALSMWTSRHVGRPSSGGSSLSSARKGLRSSTPR